MPKKCCLPNCKVQRDDPDGLHLSFYIIPADENLRKKWADNIKEHCNVEFKKYSYVCSRHFEKDCFESTISTATNRRLKKGSCPTIFLDFKSLKQQNTRDDKGVIDNQSCNISSSTSAFNYSSDTTVNNDGIGDSTYDEESSIMECDFYTQDTDTSSNNVLSNLISHEVHSLEAESTSTSVVHNVKESNDSSSCKITQQPSSSKEADALNQQGLSSLIDYNVQEKNDNSSEADSLKSSNIFKKSLANIDINSIQFTKENLPMLKRIICNGINEVITLRRKLKSKSMKMYRYKKRVTDVKSLTSHMKSHKYLSDNISKLLEVSRNAYSH